MGRARPMSPVAGGSIGWSLMEGSTVIRALKLLPRYITEKSWEPGSYG